jgi:UDP-2,3-diacylglucosamine hydrolase
VLEGEISGLFQKSQGEGAILTGAKKDWIFVADAHFTGRDPEKIKAFLRFLDLEEERIDHFVILGDLFEFFFGFKSFSSTKELFAFNEYLPVFKKFQTLRHQGIQIKYFEGNHDFFLHSFFSEQLGIEVEVYPGGCEERLEGKRAFIAHGDLSNPNQWRYHAFRKVLKNRWTYHLMHLAGPRLSRRVARKLSEMSYQKYHMDRGPNPPPAFKAFAHQKFLEGFEIVILGHSHIPERVEEWIDKRRCLYFNVGDWRMRRSFLRFTPPDHFELSRYGEG